MVKILLIQPLPAERLDSPENLRRALTLLDECQGRGADLICLPEYFPFTGEVELAQAARDLGAYLVAGLVAEHRGRRYNTATLFDRRGKLVGRQGKITLGNLERRGFGVTPAEDFAGPGDRFWPPGPAGVHRLLGPARGGPAAGGPGRGPHRQSQHLPHPAGPLAHWGPGAGLRLLPAGGGGEYRGPCRRDRRTPLPHAGRAVLCHPTPGPAGCAGPGPADPHLGRPEPLGGR